MAPPLVAGAPVGQDFQVNTYTTGSQSIPGVAVDAAGNGVVIWQSEGSSGSDSSDRSIQGQRIDAAGNRIGDEFQINTYTTDSQTVPRVSMGSTGEFVVVWNSVMGVDDRDIRAQVFDATGTPTGAEIAVNTYTTGVQSIPTVVHGSSDFVVVWRSQAQEGAIQGRRFDTTGSPLGDEFPINTYTTGSQSRPAVARSSGGFVVVWDSKYSAGPDNDFSVQGQRFDAVGSPVGEEFQVNTYSTGYQLAPSIAVNENGGFVVIWESLDEGIIDLDNSIQGQVFDAAGDPVGGEFQITTNPSGLKRGAEVAFDPSGEFLVAWQSPGSTGTDPGVSIRARRFDALGNPVAEEFQVNTYTTGAQMLPAIGVDAQGNTLVVWQSDGSADTDTSGDSVQGRRLEKPLFADGFETGDTSAWSGGG